MGERERERREKGGGGGRVEDRDIQIERKGGRGRKTERRIQRRIKLVCPSFLRPHNRLCCASVVLWFSCNANQTVCMLLLNNLVN